jgi:hypothetical protein
MEKRIVKVPLPVELIGRIDQAVVARKGGLETREQFFREAAEGFLADLSYEEAPEPVSQSRADPTRETADPDLISEVVGSVPAWEREELQLADLAGTALGAPRHGTLWDSGVAEPDQEPMLGLHNRDYPSLWAASRLSRYTDEGPIPFDEFRRRATDAAWLFGRELARITGEGDPRLTALFPTNPRKPDSSERAFQSFAIGSVPSRHPADGLIPASGPLFSWGLCQLRRLDGQLFVALTPAGHGLLEDLAEISLDLPHHTRPARLFLDYVFEHAPGDGWGFARILEAVRTRPGREEIVARIGAARPEWSAATASSVTQGYIARAREWGLLEPRLEQGKYVLTVFGEEWSSDLGAPEIQDTSGR